MMNERIKQLAEQATEEVMRNTPSFLVTNEMWKEKFAQLIIQRCITQISMIGISNFENNDIMWTVETATTSIKEHFGVEW